MVNCLIIEDEPLARDVISNFCGHLPTIRVVAECGNALDARRVLLEQQIDLMFLDINLPVLDGLAFLKTLKRPPIVIFTTAHKEYAINAFELNGCDYLVKPFSLERFIQAVDKAIDLLQLRFDRAGDTRKGHEGAEYFFIKADGIIYNLQYRDVLFAEARGNYTKVVTEGATYLSPIAFSNFEADLPVVGFMRIHRSYIVNVARISKVDGNMVFIGQYELPVSSHYKQAFMRTLGY